jgi:hypothetical protein
MSTKDLQMPNAQCWKKLLDLEIAKIVNLEAPIPIISLVQVNVTANTNIIAPTANQTPLTPKNTPCIWRIYVCLSNAGIFSVQRTAGNTIATENLNSGVALAANAAYIFDIIVDQSEKIDFQTTVTGILLKLSVLEKDDAK